MNRDELLAKYGKPSRLPDDDKNVIVFAHESQEAAEAYAEANREEYDYDAYAEQRQIWVSVVDLRPVLAELDRLKLGRDDD